MKAFKIVLNVIRWIFVVFFGYLSLVGIYGIYDALTNKFSTDVWVLGLPGLLISILIVIYALQVKIE